MVHTGYFYQVSMGRYLRPRVPKLSDDERYDYQIKLLLVGDPLTGKSALVDHYVRDEKTLSRIDDDNDCIISSENQSKGKILEKNKKKIHLRITDTAGQERHRISTPSGYKDAHGCLIVFDLTKESTFRSLHTWSNRIHEHGRMGIQAVLVGTNCLSQKRGVSKERAESFAHTIGIPYVEVSTQENFNVTRPFDMLIDMVISELEMKSCLYKAYEKTERGPEDSCVIS